jgi:hypothetical protein
MKKLFFPFSKNYKHLTNHAWHRFFVVLYWILILASLIGLYWLMQYPEIQNMSNCFSTQIYLHPGGNVNSMDSNCAVFKPDTGSNFVLAIIGTLILSYIFQLIYYKVLLYIIFGKNSRNRP